MCWSMLTPPHPAPHNPTPVKSTLTPTLHHPAPSHPTPPQHESNLTLFKSTYPTPPYPPHSTPPAPHPTSSSTSSFVLRHYFVIRVAFRRTRGARLADAAGIRSARCSATILLLASTSDLSYSSFSSTSVRESKSVIVIFLARRGPIGTVLYWFSVRRSLTVVLDVFT